MKTLLGRAKCTHMQSYMLQQEAEDFCDFEGNLSVVSQNNFKNVLESRALAHT